MSEYLPQPYVLQSGTITPGHGLVWVVNGVVADSGGPPLSLDTLPTTLPATPGVLWNNNGFLCIS
jgi:hypothetical protein